MGLSEMRWTGARRIKMTNGYTMIYAGKKREHQRGVDIMMSQDMHKTLTEWTASSHMNCTNTCNRHDIVIVIGDLNTKDCDDNKDMERTMGRHGLGSINDNGKQ